MNKLSIAFLLIISAASQAQMVTTKHFDRQLEQKQRQTQFSDHFAFEQQCPIQQIETKDDSGVISALSATIDWIAERVLKGLPWIYFTYSIGCAILLSKYYQNGQFCFSYTIVSLIKLIHNGALYMFYCQDTQGDQMQGKMFFYIIMITCLGQITRIVLSQKLNKAQKRSFAAYVSFIFLAILSFKQYYNIMTQCICFTTHILQLSYATRNRTSNKYNVPLQSINLLVNTVIFFFVPVYSQVYFQESTSGQKLFYAAYSTLLAFSSFLIVYPPIRKQLQATLLRFYHVSILKRLGCKLQIDACSICWQDMELFLGVEDIKDFYKVHRTALIRVHRNHIFHRKCLSKWTMTRNTCPLDNEQIEEI